LAHGSLVAIQIGRQAEGRLESVAEVRAIPGKGLEGDRYFRGEGSFSKNPGGGRQVTLVAFEMLELLQNEHGISLEAAETRRNLVTKGVVLNDLVGRVFQVGTVRMKGVRLAEPCNHLERPRAPGGPSRRYPRRRCAQGWRRDPRQLRPPTPNP
jgi:MOSC domain-containing protein YiiM